MKCLLFGVVMWTLVAPVMAQSPDVLEPKIAARLTAEGLLVEAGSAGQFTLKYPVLVGEKWEDVRKPIETKVSGDTAMLQFDGATRITVTWKPSERTLVFTPSNIPASVKSLRGEMLIDFSYINGGTWQIGPGKETPFPVQQPARPHLFQGHAETLRLRNSEGATLTVRVPASSYQQLIDNREWNWKIFDWQFLYPCTAGAGPLEVKLTLGAPSEKAVKLADRFGQSTRSDFPAKVKSEAELKEDIQTETAWLASLQPPAFDRFGGLPGSGAKLGLKNSGFFHVEKKDQRWILVDPEGNAFFHLGVCAFGPADDYTYFAGRERVFEWLPTHEGEFASAFHPDSYWNSLALSFHLVNTIRKFGKPHDPVAYTTRMIERVRKWGFNSAGAFGAGEASVRQQKNFPHVAHLPLSTWEGFPDVPGCHGIFDPFSEKVRERCDKVFAERLPSAATDPLLIGYFLGNEPLWEEIPGAVAALDSSQACKQKLASFLEEKYKTIEAFNRAWETSLDSFADAAARGLSVKTDGAKADMRAFTEIFLDAYFRLVTETFHKYDKNHLLIGNRFQPGTINNETTCRLSGRYMDVVTFNYYTYDFDPQLLERIRTWTGDRPMFFSEFYFSSPPDSGLTGGSKDLSTQRERGLAYCHYVEHAAALGYVVGIEWFTLVDQATTGRFFEKYNGEAANTGLISVADRPWKSMLEEMLKSNYDIYKVLLGERPPFEFNHPRFAAKAKASSASAQNGFTPLFNGKDLNGWIPMGTSDAFKVEKEAILSTGASPYPSWLRTERPYENFILRLEYQTLGWYEGGILIHAPADGPASKLGLKLHLRHDRLNYQARSPGAIYDVTAPTSLANFDSGKWNQCEVVCDWPRLQVTLNGVKIQDLDMAANPALRHRLRKGFIGFENIGCRAYFRNIVIKPLPGQEEWTSLFSPGLEEMSFLGDSRWKLSEDTLVGEGLTGFALTKTAFKGPFELQVWVKTSVNGNGGVTFNAAGRSTGTEVQCFNCPDSTNPTGSLYDIAPADRIASQDGVWFLLHIFVDGPHAMVLVNGEKVSQTDQLKPPYEGTIGFQQHTPGGHIEYRGARIRQIRWRE